METEVIDGKVQGKRGARMTPKWDPKNWKPVYESIVALSCTNLSNEEVGKRFGYTAQQVSNICNSTKGKLLRQHIANTVRDLNVKSISERVVDLQEKALQRVEAVIMSDEAFQEKPLAIFDRSLAVLKSGILKESSPPAGVPPIQQNIQKAVFMSVTPDQRSQLAEGLRKADQVKVIHSGIPESGESSR